MNAHGEEGKTCQLLQLNAITGRPRTRWLSAVVTAMCQSVDERSVVYLLSKLLFSQKEETHTQRRTYIQISSHHPFLPWSPPWWGTETKYKKIERWAELAGQARTLLFSFYSSRLPSSASLFFFPLLLYLRNGETPPILTRLIFVNISTLHPLIYPFFFIFFFF